MAFMVIHLAPGISDEDAAEVTESTAAYLETDAPYADMIGVAGFTEITTEDVTLDYVRVSEAWLDAAADLEDGLREVIGDATFEEKQANRTRALTHVEAGLVRRTLFTAIA